MAQDPPQTTGGASGEPSAAGGAPREAPATPSGHADAPEAASDPRPAASAGGASAAAEAPSGSPTAGAAGESPTASTGPGETEPAPTAAADPWEPFDAAITAFAAARPVGVGTYFAEETAVAEGRFLQWNNACGWRCVLQLVRPPEENVVVLVALGPPLPGGRARALALGAMPPEGDEAMLRAALELGYGIAETWGPVAETPSAGSPPPSTEADSAAS
jgi:hypothetical protein